jgi:hypothetical protein
MHGSRKFGWLALALALALLAWKVSGQHFGGLAMHLDFAADPPATQTSFTPASIAGLAYWWNSEDLPTNTIVTNWIDRIQGVTPTQGDPTARPTNHVYGVGFNGSTFLTNPPVGNSVGVGAFFMVVRWTDPDKALSPITSYDNGSAHRRILLASSSWAGTWNNGCRLTWIGDGGTKVAPIEGTGARSVPTNSTITLAYDQATTTFYTNGVVSKTAIGLGAYKVESIGHDPDGSFFVGHIREILIYTNGLSAAGVSNLHFFAAKP